MRQAQKPARIPRLDSELTLSRLIATCTTMLGIGLLISGFIGPNYPLGDPLMCQVAGIAVLTLGFWATGTIPEFFTSLLFLFLCLLFAVAEPERVFSGFRASGMWLIFGGLVIGMTVTQVGLGERLLNRILTILPASYVGVLTTVALSGVALSFALPTAIGRAILITPIAMQLASKLGFEIGSAGRTGVIMTAGMSTTLPAFAILPANVPNLVMSSSAESLYGVTHSFGPYIALNFPILGGFSVLATIGLNWFFFSDEPKNEPKIKDGPSLKPSKQERKLAVVLIATILLWLTDSIHGISPSWVAMGAALFCIAPGFGIVPTADFTKKINFAPMFFVAGVVGFGAVVSDVGLAEYMGNFLVGAFQGLDANNDFVAYLALISVGMTVAVTTMLPTAPAVMTPIAGQLADATGFPIETVLMAQVPTWIVIPLPYLAPPLFATLALSGIAAKSVMRMMLCYFALGVLVALPMHFLWGRWMGHFL